MLRLDIVTVFPEMVASALEHSIVKRARERGLIDIRVVNLRDFTHDRHKTTDDLPYGGGGGMVMKIEPIARAVFALSGQNQGILSPSFGPEDFTAVRADKPNAPAEPFFGVPSNGQDAIIAPEVEPARDAQDTQPVPPPRVVLTDPRGPRFTQATARQWASEAHIIILCGHYEGVDERVRQHLVTDEVSIGDYILTGGELPALIIADALARLQPGALGDEQGAHNDTFTDDLLEYPHYTRPASFEGWQVPDVLLSGHHAQIEKWRRWHALRATRERRPDLFARLQLSKADLKLLSGEEPNAPPDSLAAARKALAGTPGPEQAIPLRADSDGREETEEINGTGTGNHS